jgi:hypothetical protein
VQTLFRAADFLAILGAVTFGGRVVGRFSAMDNLFAFPSRNLIRVTLFLLVVAAVVTAGYIEAGWNIQDSLYMVTLTVFTVGYGEVHPIDTPYLHALTVATIVFGCTGIIFFTGALVQFFGTKEGSPSTEAKGVLGDPFGLHVCATESCASCRRGPRCRATGRNLELC